MHKRLFVILAALLALWPLCGRTQGFLEVDWDECRIDSVLPVFTHNIPLDEDYVGYEHTVRMEYPEYEPVSAAEELLLKKSLVNLPEVPVVNSYIGVSAKKGTLHVSLIPLVCRDGKFFKLTSLKLVVEKVPELMLLRSSASPSDSRYADSSMLAQGKWVKVRVTETGVHRISHNELRAMGFADPAKVRLFGQGGQMLSEKNIQDCVDDLKEVPLYRGDSYVLFYAHGTVKWTRSGDTFVHSQNTYSRYGYYFLTDNASGEPAEFLAKTMDRVGTNVTTFPDYALYERDACHWKERGRIFFENYDFKNGNSKTYTFRLPDVDVEGMAKVTLSFGSDAPTASTVNVAVNGSQCGTLKVPLTNPGSYTKVQIASGVYTCTGKLSENTSVVLTHSGALSGSSRLDYLTLNYQRQLKLDGAYTRFRTRYSGYCTFHIAGTNANTKVWKISDKGAAGYGYTELGGTMVDGMYEVGDVAALSDEYVVLDVSSASFPSVEVVGAVANQNLHALGAMDMIIVVPSSALWLAQAERLADLHRAHDSLRVSVVRADQIYNEFSSGAPDATAIRRFMKMFYDRAAHAEDLPKYLLLFADCAADNRMISSSWSKSDPDNYLLCFQSENSVSETTSYVMEEYFCLLDDSEGTAWTRSKADAAVGRLTVHSLAEAKNVVDKIEAYMTNREAGPWKNKVCVMGDDGDGNDHMGDAEQIAKQIHAVNPSYIIEKVYWDAFVPEIGSTGTRYPDVTRRIRELSAEGVLMINYFGHGRADELSHELAWDINEMKALNSPRLPLWVTAACDTSPIDLPEENMGEAALLNDHGGAIAVLGTTRSTYRSGSMPLDRAFTKYVFKGYPMGEALRLAKNETNPYANQENNLHFVLIGDPALRLATPDRFQVQLSEVNGMPVRDGGGLSQFKAGSLVTLKGKIVDEGGALVETFNGLIHPSIYDSQELVVCKGNATDPDEIFEFWDLSQKVYAGSDSIRHGEFTFTFPVPLDISYSEEQGHIYFYALDESRQEAQGSYDNFSMNGTADGLVTDSVGPEIQLYLNSTDFVAGDRVNATPLLMLSLHDKEGVNATGNGVGHDIIAIVDNDPSMTYVLNSYYVSEPGDFTRGTVCYSLPPLSPGFHTILVRVWDVMNNSSTIEVPFEVVEGLGPSMFTLWSTESPARTSTTFVLTHNRPQSEVEVRMEVFDFMGRLLWEHVETGVSSSGEYRIGWDLTTNSGQPIGSGVYLYRATISSGGGSTSTKARKIVILRQ